MSPLAILIIALAIVIGGVLVFRLHPFVILIMAAFAVALLTPADTALPSAGQRVAEGFGKTCLDIGIVIAMASVLGTCLSAAGGARRIVVAIQRTVGERRTPLALLMAGFILGIPMFAETVFYLLMPLARAAWERMGRSYLLSVLAIVGGATMTHSLVPPTPGPLFVAETLSVDMATMIMVGLTVGIIAALAGFAYARWSDQQWPLTPDASTDSIALCRNDSGSTTDRMPPLWAALMPILLPVVLISLDSASRSAPGLFVSEIVPLVRLCGEKNLALSIAAVASILVLVATGAGMVSLRTTVASAITEAGSIILVIAGGGALGGTLRQAGLADLSTGLGTGSGLGLILIAWLVTAVVRIAQGSATVAMITAAGVMAPFVSEGNLPFHPVYVAVAIGCGSKMGMWMNDSGFWVISRMSGMTEMQTLRTASAMVAIEGTVGLAATLGLSLLFPMC